jgi:hypothetical protein
VDPSGAADLDKAGRKLDELQRVDPVGAAYRYATTNTGEPWPSALKDGQIAVDRFHRVCEGLSNLLSGCADQVDAYRAAGP